MKISFQDISFKAIVEQIGDYGIVVLDASGIVRSWNAGARAITGFNEQEALGRPLTAFLNEDLVAKAVKSGRASMQCWLERKGGRPLWTANVVQTVTGDRGATSLCWMCQDPFDN